MRTILGWFGYEVFYVCSWGIYKYRYNGSDHHMNRPIHSKMSVAPPYATMVIQKIKGKPCV